MSVWIGVIILAFVFTFIVGFHDGCNVIGSAICSRSLSPSCSLLLASISEFLGPIFLGTAVAVTIGKQIIDPGILTPSQKSICTVLIFTALLSATSWNIITWWIGIPSSSSHALIGGLVGAGIGAYGVKVVNWHIFLIKVIGAMFVTPIFAFLLSFLIMKLTILFLSGAPSRLNIVFKRLHFLSVMCLGASHGTNDAQKCMGLVTLILVINGKITSFHVPLWLVLASAGSLALGVSMGGWRIIKTIGKITCKLSPVHSFNAQMAASIIVIISSLLGGAVSTTQVTNSSLVGVGVAWRFSSVRWNVARDIVNAWLVTIPFTILLSAVIMYGIKIIFFG